MAQKSQKKILDEKLHVHMYNLPELSQIVRVAGNKHVFTCHGCHRHNFSKFPDFSLIK